MSSENPIPNPPPVPPSPSPFPGQDQPVNMRSRWIGWVVASAFIPIIGWLIAAAVQADDVSVVFLITGFALICQFVASILVAQGFCARRGSGIGAVFGMTIVFFLASVAIGTAVWFAGCLVFLSTGSFH